MMPAALRARIVSVFSLTSASAPTVAMLRASLGMISSAALFLLAPCSSLTSLSIFIISASTSAALSRRESSRAPTASIASFSG